MSIRIGILGYGNLGRGVECAIKHNPDLELVAVFTRRAPETVKILTETAAVYSVNDAEKMKDKIDVLIICGGSATDLPKQTPEYAKMFNVIDSFDTHARIPEHFDSVDAAAKESGHIGIISVGWDPGMFSLNRLYANAILTNGKDYTFWGKGVSQGHSDAVRRIKGVKDAKQYTIPVEAALEAVRNGENPDLTTRQKHTRECFVVAEEGADLAQIENDIKTVLDVLGYLDEIPVCTGYEIDGKVTTEFPTTTLLEKAKPVLETLPGWKCDIRGIKKYEDLPENCRKYVEFVEKHIGFPITMISNGPGRDDIIYRNK